MEVQNFIMVKEVFASNWLALPTFQTKKQKGFLVGAFAVLLIVVVEIFGK